MRIGNLFALLVSVLCAGCAARLSTKVEVYHPEIRLLEMADERGKQPATRLEERMSRQVEHYHKQVAGDPQPRHEARVAYLRACNKRSTNVWNALAPALAPYFGTNQVELVALAAIGTSYLGNCNSLFEAALTDVEDGWKRFGAGEIPLVQAEGEANSRLFCFSQAFQRALNPVESGDTTILPPPVVDVLREDSGSKPALPQQPDLKAAKEEINASQAFVRTIPSKTDKGGVFRPDSIVETYTDPLLKLAVKDTLGWTCVPAATTTSADGKSSVVLVRDGQFSFSVHSFDNDPTEVVAARARLAVSTAKIVAESVAMFSGVPKLPGSGAQPGVPNTAGTDTELRLVPDSVLSAIANDRERRAAELLNAKPDVNDADAVKRWLDQVNALFAPVVFK